MISVIIGTYGSSEWRDLAWSRAHPSVPLTDEYEPLVNPVTGREYWPSTEVVVVHADTLAQARNMGVRSMSQLRPSQWLCFLDADDELTPGYLATMTKAIRYTWAMTGKKPLKTLFTPAVEYVGAGGRMEKPMFHPPVKIEDGNWLVIGTVIPRALFLKVGGFEEFPKYEDWALFARLQKAGANVVKVHDAVYRAYRNPNGRNHEGGRNAKLAAHDQIRRAVFPELYA